MGTEEVEFVGWVEEDEDEGEDEGEDDGEDEGEDEGEEDGEEEGGGDGSMIVVTNVTSAPGLVAVCVLLLLDTGGGGGERFPPPIRGRYDDGDESEGKGVAMVVVMVAS